MADGDLTLFPIDAKYGMDPSNGEIRKLDDDELLLCDEPLILFRASDGMALGMLTSYVENCSANGADLAFLATVYRRMADFAEWQAANLTSVKLPD
jgi:hypothetical protein